MVRNVVTPAVTSVRTSEPRSDSLNQRSSFSVIGSTPW